MASHFTSLGNTLEESWKWSIYYTTSHLHIVSKALLEGFVMCHNIREVKLHVYVKWQTRSCTT